MTSSPITPRHATLFALSALAIAVAAPNAPAFTGPSTPSQDQPSQVAAFAGPALARHARRRCRAGAGAGLGGGHAGPASPDTRDVANGYDPKPVPVGTTRTSARPTRATSRSAYDPEPVAVAVPEPSGEGFDWVSAAIGAAAIGGLILLLVGFMNGRGGHIGRRGALHT